VFRWRESARPEHESVAALSADAAAALPAPSPVELAAIPAGGHTQSVLLSPVSPPPASSVATAAGRRFSWLALTLVLVAAAVAVAAYKLDAPLQQGGFRAFWQPWTSSSKPVIISIGSNAVYRLSYELTDRYARENHLEDQGMEFFVPTADPSVSGKDFAPAPNSFVALGDVAAVSEVVATLTRQGQAFQERFPNDVSFAELRNSPTVLVGGFNNPMTIELTRHLPFVMNARNEIEDTTTGKRWVLHAPTDSHYTEDYAIITRLPQENGDAPILSVAGMGAYGTLAASSFICNPASIAQLTLKLPKGWQNRNLQLVLHVDVVDFKPSSSQIVTARSW
jgi:hypothetical protein